jgi:hypothetical protein
VSSHNEFGYSLRHLPQDRLFGHPHTLKVPLLLCLSRHASRGNAGSPIPDAALSAGGLARTRAITVRDYLDLPCLPDSLGSPGAGRRWETQRQRTPGGGIRRALVAFRCWRADLKGNGNYLELPPGMFRGLNTATFECWSNGNHSRRMSMCLSSMRRSGSKWQ